MVSYQTPLSLCQQFTRGVNSQCCYTSLQLRYFPVLLIRIKGIQTGHYEVQMVSFADDTSIFLRDIKSYFKTMRKDISK